MKGTTKIFRPAFLILSIAVLAMGLISLYYNLGSFYAVVIAGSVTLFLFLLSIVSAKKKLDVFVNQLGEQIDKSQGATLTELGLGIIITDLSGEIVWYNDSCRDKIFNFKEWYGKDIKEIFGNSQFNENGFSIVFLGKCYTVFGAKGLRYVEDKYGVSTPTTLNVYYFCEDTHLKHQAQQYLARRPSIFAIAIDSIEDVIQDAKENERSQLMAQIEKAIEQFVGENDGFVIKSDRYRFYAIIEERYMSSIIEKRFALLDKVRAITMNKALPVTLSIGVARDSDTYPQGETAARQALEMAQGRGGDQAAVKTKNGYDFYGGVSKGVEKRTKVKTRIVATALTELIMSSDNVVIMGHKFADLDSFGAAVGLLGAIKTMGKPAIVAINRVRNMVQSLIETMEKNGYENCFYNPSDAMDFIGEKTLLIVVDTHLEHVLESAEVYRAAKTVVVIDHHRRMVGYIDNAVIFYHEPYASSTAEMVTELVQYLGEGTKISRLEAEALLAGIMLDTRNFVLRTGVRTFEAAAYLRRQGADTVEVSSMFSSTMESYKHRAGIVSNSEIYQRCAISTISNMTDDIRLIAPQAADELLKISDVDASFVLYEYGDEISISARSMGKVNVQVIMEELGGGGHLTMAATQIKDTSIEAARQRLLEAIDSYCATKVVSKDNA